MKSVLTGNHIRHLGTVLVVHAEASYHAAYDHCTAAYFRQGAFRQLVLFGSPMWG